jgi:ABC-type multidrug transport system fused ATPase/permease subunit
MCPTHSGADPHGPIGASGGLWENRADGTGGRGGVRLGLAFVVVVVATALAIGAMLFVRRRAPDGSYFNDGDRAAGVFGVLATGFAVLLGFVVFLAFESYDAARSGAEREALITAQQVETAQFLPEPAASELTGELVCYARSVAGVQWTRMENGTLGEQLNPFAADMFRTIRTVEPEAASEQSAYDRWHDQTSAREEARNDRIHGAVGVIPTPLWIVLFLSAALIITFMLFFADSGEPAFVQAMLMGSVVAVITATLLLLTALDNPFHSGIGGLRPVAMERALKIIDQELAVAGAEVTPPCDAAGKPA